MHTYNYPLPAALSLVLARVPSWPTQWESRISCALEFPQEHLQTGQHQEAPRKREREGGKEGVEEEGREEMEQMEGEDENQHTSVLYFFVSFFVPMKTSNFSLTKLCKEQHHTYIHTASAFFKFL